MIEPEFDADKPAFVMPDLTGEQGNAFYLIGAGCRLLKQAGHDQTFVDGFREECMSGDYKHLLATLLTYFNVVEQVKEYRITTPDSLGLVENEYGELT